MTKPAAVFMQLLGVIVLFISIGMQSWAVAGIGFGMLVWGGAATRKRIKQGT